MSGSSSALKVNNSGSVILAGGVIVDPFHSLPRFVSITSTFTKSRFSRQEAEIEDLWRETEADPGQQAVVTVQTQNTGLEFLRRLPVDIRVAPEISVLPNGQISLQWSSALEDVTVIVRDTEIHYGHRMKTGERYSGFSKWAGKANSRLIEIIREIAG